LYIDKLIAYSLRNIFTSTSTYIYEEIFTVIILRSKLKILIPTEYKYMILTRAEPRIFTILGY
jgi:hypothetical protein